MCRFGLYTVLAGVVLVTLCGCVCCCVLPGVFCHWRRTRGYGQWYIESIGCKCRYRLKAIVVNGIRKTRIRWEIDPKALARFASVTSEDFDQQENRETCNSEGLDVEAGRFATALVEDSSSPRETCQISSGSSSCSDVLGSDRLVFRSGQHLSREGCDKSPVANVANVHAAYPHGSFVEYYSCTNQCWLRGVVTLDALDRHVHGSLRVEEVVYGVHLTRTQQFRNHAALYHLRKPLEIGHVIEVPTNPQTTWKPATIKKIMLGKTQRFYVLEIEGEKAIVPASSVRRCFPVKSQVFKDVCVGSLVVSQSSQNSPLVSPPETEMRQDREREGPSQQKFLAGILTQLHSQLPRSGTM